MPNPIPQQCWQIISVDLIVGLPLSWGYNALLVVVDRLSKWMHALPTTEEVTSLGIAHLF